MEAHLSDAIAIGLLKLHRNSGTVAISRSIVHYRFVVFAADTMLTRFALCSALLFLALSSAAPVGHLKNVYVVMRLVSF